MLVEIDGFEWDEANKHHVLFTHKERNLTKHLLESVLEDPNLYSEFLRYDERRGTPIYQCLGLNFEGKLMQVTFELTKENLARIFHAHRVEAQKYQARYRSGR